MNQPITVMFAVSAKAKNVGVTVTSQRYVPVNFVETDSSTTRTWSEAVICGKNPALENSFYILNLHLFSFLSLERLLQVAFRLA